MPLPKTRKVLYLMFPNSREFFPLENYFGYCFSSVSLYYEKSFHHDFQILAQCTNSNKIYLNLLHKKSDREKFAFIPYESLGLILFKLTKRRLIAKVFPLCLRNFGIAKTFKKTDLNEKHPIP